MKNRRLALLLAGVLTVGCLATGCGNSGGGEDAAASKETATISVSGSTSVGPSMEKIAERFEKANEGVSVEIQQIGSSAGIKNAIDGVSEIGMASRDLKEEEKSAGLQETKIAIDGIAVITNKNNPVKNLTTDQVKDIYTGKITNWKEVGGKNNPVKNLTTDQVKDIYTGKITNWKEVGGNDAPIVVVSREEGSGTRDGFQEIVGFESTELLKDAQVSDGSGNIKSTVENNPVKNLTTDQVKDIYTGKITNWKEVGGNDAPIVVVSREEGSGTRDGFQEIVGFESTELLKDAQVSDGSGNIKSTVEGNDNAIGYISFGYVDDAINALNVNDVEPTADNVTNSSYPIARPFLLVDKQDGLSENGKKLIDFVLSAEGQQIMEDEGFIKINK